MLWQASDWSQPLSDARRKLCLAVYKSAFSPTGPCHIPHLFKLVTSIPDVCPAPSRSDGPSWSSLGFIGGSRRASMDFLPVELVRLVFQYCDAPTVRALRLAAGRYADVGYEYLLHTHFNAVEWRDDVSRLRSIAGHDRLRSSIRSL